MDVNLKTFFVLVVETTKQAFDCSLIARKGTSSNLLSPSLSDLTVLSAPVIFDLFNDAAWSLIASAVG